ncbi:hypothetical protein BJ508DRAFT_413215 [Ascobolus immersus RN42]|uniref:Uncharacterized protein n=1 Tax=Ascobolus immersus RN42 TaxID=1160509 RepID=A0A3N4IDM8_ASCIM|nr:hypothetical protein BJ508DRAFT_413215 [Ascobolus immersus RN42]
MPPGRSPVRFVDQTDRGVQAEGQFGVESNLVGLKNRGLHFTSRRKRSVELKRWDHYLPCGRHWATLLQ